MRYAPSSRSRPILPHRSHPCRDPLTPLQRSQVRAPGSKKATLSCARYPNFGRPSLVWVELLARQGGAARQRGERLGAKGARRLSGPDALPLGGQRAECEGAGT